MRKRCKEGSVWALALGLLVSLWTVPAVYGANGIDTGRACSLDIKLDGQYPELEDLTVPVNLYRVASVAENGAYTDLEGFGSLNLSKVNSQTTAEEWSKLGAQAAEIVAGGSIAPSAQIQLEKQTGQEHSQGKASGLATGMYLVEAGSVQSAEYTYDFIPYLAAVPANYYGETGDDTWIYDVETSLKPERLERYGSLLIEKALDSYNATVGGASFVFQVEAEKNGNSVYSDVASLTFDGPGTKTLLIDRIPAGASVRVREVYSGSSYSPVSEAEQTVSITAEGTGQVRARFENTYDQRPNSGSSIVNHFQYENGVWTPEQLRDSSGE